MTLMFLHPELLILAPIIAIGGWLLLRVTGNPEHIFTILEFWPRDSAQARGKTRHRTDWPWVLILLAAVLSALALSSPRVRYRPASLPTPPPRVAIRAVGRELPGRSEVLDLFVQSLLPDKHTAGSILVTADNHKIHSKVSPQALARGIDISPVPAAPTLAITLSQSGRVLAHTTVSRSAGITRIAAHFIGTPPPAFLRLFAAMPGIQWHAGISGPGIWIIQHRHFYPADLQGIADSAIVLLGDTPGPGLRPGGYITFPRPQTPMIVNRNALMRSVNPSTVQVHKIIKARLGPSWQTLVSVRGLPWLAERNDPSIHITWLWLAGGLNSSWSDWPRHASFVICFANLMSEIKTLSGPARQGAWWKPAPSRGAEKPARFAPAALRTIPLDIVLSILVCACLMAAVVGLALRATKTALSI